MWTSFVSILFFLFFRFFSFFPAPPFYLCASISVVSILDVIRFCMCMPNFVESCSLKRSLLQLNDTDERHAFESGGGSIVGWIVDPFLWSCRRFLSFFPSFFFFLSSLPLFFSLPREAKQRLERSTHTIHSFASAAWRPSYLVRFILLFFSRNNFRSD